MQQKDPSNPNKTKGDRILSVERKLASREVNQIDRTSEAQQLFAEITQKVSGQKYKAVFVEFVQGQSKRIVSEWIDFNAPNFPADHFNVGDVVPVCWHANELIPLTGVESSANVEVRACKFTAVSGLNAMPNVDTVQNFWTNAEGFFEDFGNYVQVYGAGILTVVGMGEMVYCSNSGTGLSTGTIFPGITGGQILPRENGEVLSYFITPVIYTTGSGSQACSQMPISISFAEDLDQGTIIFPKVSFPGLGKPNFMQTRIEVSAYYLAISN